MHPPCPPHPHLLPRAVCLPSNWSGPRLTKSSTWRRCLAQAEWGFNPNKRWIYCLRQLQLVIYLLPPIVAVLNWLRRVGHTMPRPARPHFPPPSSVVLTAKRNMHGGWCWCWLGKLRERGKQVRKVRGQVGGALWQHMRGKSRSCSEINAVVADWTWGRQERGAAIKY